MNIGKKILSAFVEVTEDKKTVEEKEYIPPVTKTTTTPASGTGKFKQYFDKLFTDANIPGPDYYEFSKMVEAMRSIPDEKARYAAAFAGLQVQGLDKEKLLSTATEYIKLLDADAASFNSTIDAALEEKVRAKRREIEEKNMRIQKLSQEIADLQAGIGALTNEIGENEEKIANSTGGYATELEIMKTNILVSIEKIKQHIQ